MLSGFFFVMFRNFLPFVVCLCAGLCPWSAGQAEEPDPLVAALLGIDDPKVQASFLRGMLSGLEGRREAPAPEGWGKLKAKLEGQGDAEVLKLLAQLNRVFGDEKAIRAALDILRDEKAEREARRSALKALLDKREAAAFAALEGLLEDEALRLDAIRGYAAFDDSRAPGILLDRYEKFGPDARRAVVETLAGRNSYARALTAALAGGRVKRNEVPAYVARSLKALLGADFEKVYGEVREVSAEKGKLMAAYKRKMTSPAMEKADASRGRVVYKKACAACHVMYGEGGKIGPELTGSNRADPDYLLLNVLDPSYDVPEGYRMVTVVAKDGRVYAGNVKEEDDVRIVLTMVGQTSVIAKSEVRSRVVSKASLMPEGLFSTLTDQEFLDLVRYLRTEQQVPLPK